MILNDCKFGLNYSDSHTHLVIFWKIKCI